MESTQAVRRAGTQPAGAATRKRRTIAVAPASGSAASSPNSRVAINRMAYGAPGTTAVQEVILAHVDNPVRAERIRKTILNPRDRSGAERAKPASAGDCS